MYRTIEEIEEHIEALASIDDRKDSDGVWKRLWIAESDNLGALARLSIAAVSLGVSRPADWCRLLTSAEKGSRFSIELEFHLGDKLGNMFGGTERAKRVNPSYFYHLSLHRRVVEVLNDRARDEGRERILVDDFLNLEFSANRPKEFYHWLDEGVLPPILDLSELRQDHISYQSSGLDKKLEEVTESLMKSTSWVGLTTVVTDDNWVLGSYVVKEAAKFAAKKLSLPVCYIPLRGTSPFRSDYSDDLSEILYRLVCFFERKPFERSKVVLAKSIPETIQHLRAALQNNPCVIVFDGVIRTRDRDELLRSIIRNSQVEMVIARLCEPLVVPESHALGIYSPTKSRIIVTANQALNRLNAKHSQLFAESLILIDKPSPSEREALLPLLQISPALTHQLKHLNCYQQFCNTGSDSSFVLLSYLLEISERVDGVTEKLNEVPASGLSHHEWLAGILLECVSDQNSSAMLFFLILAVDPTGTRMLTLLHFATELNRTIDPTVNLTQARAELDHFLELLGPLIDVREADHAHHELTKITPIDFPRNADLSYEELRASNLFVTLDFSIPRLRRLIYEMTSGGNLERKLLRYRGVALTQSDIHRLIMNEALSQQTKIWRHFQGIEFSTVSEYRRQIQGVFHGVKWLMSADDSSLTFARDVVPGKKDDAFRFLYLFAYKQCMEGDGWRMERRLGAETVKYELLKLFEPAVEKFANGDSRFFSSHLFSLAHVCYSLGFSSEAKTALARIGTLATHRNDSSQIYQERKERAFAWKIGLHAIDGQDYNQKAAMEVLSSKFNMAELDSYIEQTRERGQILIQGMNFEPELANLPEAIELPVNASSSLLDLLNRHGEVLAVQSDLRLEIIMQDWLENNPLSFRESSKGRAIYDQRIERAYSDVLESFAFLRLAEHLRLRIYSSEVGDSSFRISGHATRVYIRLLLALERFSREKYLLKNVGDPSVGAFGLRAISMNGLLTRHNYRWPRERAASLIIESQISRILSSSRSSLEHSMGCIKEAELLVQNVDTAARIHLRLGLEGIKIHRQASYLSHEPLSRRKAHLEHSGVLLESFKERIVGRAGLGRSSLWEAIAELQEIKHLNAKAELIKVAK